MGIKVHYLHREIDTLERMEILRDLRLGVHDVVVGINLLREGLDLPEVSLVAILDADKEGFLRSEGSLIQTIGRAARHVDGQVIMYADTMTGSMKAAIDETYRRRAMQIEYNERARHQPRGIQKAIRDISNRVKAVAEQAAAYSTEAGAPVMPKDEMALLIKDLEKSRCAGCQELQFEEAAAIRDQVVELKKLLVAEEPAGSRGPGWPARTEASRHPCRGRVARVRAGAMRRTGHVVPTARNGLGRAAREGGVDVGT